MVRTHIRILMFAYCFHLLTYSITESIDFFEEGSFFALVYPPHLPFTTIAFQVDRGHGYEGVTMCNFTSKECVSNTSGYAQFLIYGYDIYEPYTTMEIRSISRSMANWRVIWNDVNGTEYISIAINLTIKGTVSNVLVEESSSYNMMHVPGLPFSSAAFLVDRGHGYEGVTRCNVSSIQCVSSFTGYTQVLILDVIRPYTILEIQSVSGNMTNWTVAWTDLNGYEHLPVPINITTFVPTSVTSSTTVESNFSNFTTVFSLYDKTTSSNAVSKSFTFTKVSTFLISFTLLFECWQICSLCL